MNVLTAVIRTGTAYVVGAVLAALTLISINVPEDGAVALTGFLMLVFANAYYLLVTLLARLAPWVGYLLLIPTTPTYGAGWDLLWAFIRTLIPAVVGLLIALIPVEWFVVDPATQTTIVVSITSAVQVGYYAAARWAETKVPWLSILLGAPPKAVPTYRGA